GRYATNSNHFKEIYAMYKESLEKNLREAKEARSTLKHLPGIKVGPRNPIKKGLYLTNYANCLLNRQIDIFDDSLLLLEKGRIQSACVLSRGMIETHAFARLMNKEIEKILNSQEGFESVDASIDMLLTFINSSRFKEKDQKNMKKGLFDPNDYMFTDEARYRLEHMLAGSKHVMDALRDLYRDELKETGMKESQFEQLYDVLSEWVHPSQKSIYHYYVPETHTVPTSVGDIHMNVSASLHCARALHFIMDTQRQHQWSYQLAQEIDRRS
ncbi:MULTISPECIES: DUF5677 domain-containing protein, partial [Pantoea]